MVFLARKKPPHVVKNLLNGSFYKSRTALMIGSSLDESDLRRTDMRNASAVFMMSGKNLSTPSFQGETLKYLTFSFFFLCDFLTFKIGRQWIRNWKMNIIHYDAGLLIILHQKLPCTHTTYYQKLQVSKQVPLRQAR